MWTVNMRKDEYNRIQKRLEDYHKDEITSIKDVIKDIRQILEKGGGLNIEKTSNNLLLLLDVIETDILPLTEDVFQETEQCVDTVITGFNNIDTL